MRERTDDAGVHMPDDKLVPCDRCGELTLEDFLEPAPECCARERRVCSICADLLIGEDHDEHEANTFDARQHVDAESLRLMR